MREQNVDDLIAWLEKSPLYPKVYWKGKYENKEIAALGATKTYSSPYATTAPLFGGMRFMPTQKKDPTWHLFKDSYFFEPLAIRQGPPSPPSPYLCQGEKKHLPTYPEWEARIQTILNSPVDKVVLARRTAFETSTNPYDLLRTLLQPHLTCFLFQPQEGLTFLGATPERLYKREGRLIETEALAATRPSHEAHLFSEKEHREFALVKEHIDAILSPLCIHLDQSPQDELMHAGHLVHKRCGFKGLLKENIDDNTLLTTLHPTPATAGLPTKEALDLIEQLEPFDRGWYAGPIGWITQGTADIAVAIRSALITHTHTHIFTGAGIVAGSLPLAEWNELNLKALPFFA